METQRNLAVTFRNGEDLLRARSGSVALQQQCLHQCPLPMLPPKTKYTFMVWAAAWGCVDVQGLCGDGFTPHSTPLGPLLPVPQSTPLGPDCLSRKAGAWLPKAQALPVLFLRCLPG